MNDLCVSIVSHKQADISGLLLRDLNSVSTDLDVVFTSNVDEEWKAPDDFRHPLQWIRNDAAKGFSANHNQAFRRCSADTFCVMNPDIRFSGDPFGGLADAFADPSVGVVAPLIVSPSGVQEDSARYFPTPMSLFNKARGRDDGRYPASLGGLSQVDWVAGMFMMFRAEAFADVGGFDERFFLYYEDVDICARLWKAGWKVVLQPTVSVVHDARRSSHKDMKYASLHARSMMLYFAKHLGRLPDISKSSADKTDR